MKAMRRCFPSSSYYDDDFSMWRGGAAAAGGGSIAQPMKVEVFWPRPQDVRRLFPARFCYVAMAAKVAR